MDKIHIDRHDEGDEDCNRFYWVVTIGTGPAQCQKEFPTETQAREFVRAYSDSLKIINSDNPNK